ncbi:2S sulfur-rich seed storage protein 1-like [Salvia hispanica]|uniref:2S sulfur-rich seed storage protein 1-like n=1 Tax=Salvia hispanica TaxID=49212 RepID=UPI0020091E88|nr:2S sulfur-rich seed storage protein 1-like [Salvia hispanica]
MANAAAILILLIASAAAASASTQTTTMFKDEKCKREFQEMTQWQCVMWIASEPFGDAIAPNRRYLPEEHLFSCCEHLKSLSSDCRCDAVWEMMMEYTGYGDIACALGEQCGLECSLTCPGYRRGPALA